MLPDGDGLDICRQIRDRSDSPILMLTARGDPMDRVVGLEMGADDYLPKPFEPRELLARLRAIVRRSRVHEDVDLAALAAEECARYDDCGVAAELIVVSGDPMLLRRMIRNLLENAKLHGEPPIEVTVARRDDRAVLNVFDRGPVIAEDARERLFSTFYRIRATGGTKGSGLGLALAQQIARRHGGDVAYNPERGSSFTVTLPASA
jgi:signal transduction histidine kinase